MNVELVIKLAAVGILSSVLHMILSKAGRDDIALAVSIAALTIVMMIVVNMLGELMNSLRVTFGLGEW